MRGVSNLFFFKKIDYWKYEKTIKKYQHTNMDSNEVKKFFTGEVTYSLLKELKFL